MRLKKTRKIKQYRGGNDDDGLLDWIPFEEINWGVLSKNPAAIHLLEANPRNINWRMLSRNPAAIHLLEANPEKINWNWLSANPAAIHLIEANQDKIDWYWLSQNPAAIHLIETNLDKISWRELSYNPAAIHLLEANPEKIDWILLSRNPAAIHLLEANPEKINWILLSMNPAAIHLLDANPEKISWPYLSTNPAAIHLLKANPEKIKWDCLFENPAIFKTNGVVELDDDEPIDRNTPFPDCAICFDPLDNISGPDPSQNCQTRCKDVVNVCVNNHLFHRGCILNSCNADSVNIAEQMGFDSIYNVEQSIATQCPLCKQPLNPSCNGVRRKPKVATKNIGDDGMEINMVRGGGESRKYKKKKRQHTYNRRRNKTKRGGYKRKMHKKYTQIRHK